MTITKYKRLKKRLEREQEKAAYYKKISEDVAIKNIRQIDQLSQLIEEHKKTNKKLISANKRIKSYASKLKKSNALKDTFMDIIRHDILNAISIIKGYTELLTKEKHDSKMKIIQSNIDRVIEIIENAKKYAKLEQKIPLKKEYIDIKKVIQDVCSDIRPKFKKENLKLINRIKSPIIVSTNIMIYDVFLNLLNNTLKYAKEGKKVEITAQKINNKNRISVIDYGVGIPDDFKKHIFLRFTRFDKAGIKGTGLGLAIVKGIVDLNKGKVWVEDNPKGGAIFIVEF